MVALELPPEHIATPERNGAARTELRHFEEGSRLNQRGRFEEAVGQFDQATSAFPEAWVNRGNSLASLRRYREAIASYQHALDSHVRLPAMFNIGLAFGRLEQWQEALSWFQQVTEIDPRDPEAWYSASVALINLGQDHAAEEALSRTLELQPENVAALKNLAAILAKRNALEGALSAYERALSIAPTELGLRDGRANVLAQLGQPEEAIREYKKILDENPAYTDALYNLALTLKNLNRAREAIQVLERFFLVDQKDFHARELYRQIVDDNLRSLAHNGFASWSGERVRGSKNPVPVTAGPPVSDYLVEDRR
jgi:tetratricopeptide (TPR) repeat protein